MKHAFIPFIFVIGCGTGAIMGPMVVSATPEPSYIYEADPNKVCTTAADFGCHVECATNANAWHGEPHGAWRVVAQKDDDCAYGFADTVTGYMVDTKARVPYGAPIVGTRAQ